MINDARTVLTCGQYVPHAGLVHIKTTELRNFALIRYSLIKLNVVSCALNVPLQSFSLLRLWRLDWLRHLSLQLKWKAGLHAVPSQDYLVVAASLLVVVGLV